MTHKEQMHAYYLANKPRWAKYAKKPKTAEEKEVKNLQKRQWKEAHPEKELWSNAKYRAKRDGIEFNLEMSDVIVPTHCLYLGIILTCKKGERHCDSLMSLDRIDPTRGYVRGNVEVISYKANRMKNDASREELLTFASNILKKLCV